MIEDAIIETAKKMIVEQDREGAVGIVEKVIASGEEPLELMNRGFIPGINKVGELFGCGQLFLPELMQAANVMKEVTDLINSRIEKGQNIKSQNIKKAGTLIMATVKGDVHDIGKAIVVSLFRANGFIVHDLGRDVETDRIIEEAVKSDADVIGTSALLTTTMGQQKILEEALKSAGLRERFRTIVGGAPVTARWAARIGADAYAEDAQDGINKVKALLRD